MKRWTVILLALVLSGCTTVAGATGGTIQSTAPEKVTVQVYVDNKHEGTATVFIDDRTLYVPADLGGRLTNYTSEFANNEWRVYLRPRQAGTWKVGEWNSDYEAKILDAIRLLQEKAPQHYERLRDNVELIIPGLSNVAYPEQNVITLAKEDLDKGTVTWLAGSLAHEAEHLYRFHTDRNLTAEEQERLAYEASLDALRLVGADQREIDWTLKALQDPPTWEDNAK